MEDAYEREHRISDLLHPIFNQPSRNICVFFLLLLLNGPLQSQDFFYKFPSVLAACFQFDISEEGN